jgi:hypothetical protein
MKKIRGVKLIGVIMHIYMEISQGNALCSYLYFFFHFSSTKSENRKVEQVLHQGGEGGGRELVPVGRGR